jgi:site-specific DNA-methyltransferase (adenine-specific)
MKLFNGDCLEIMKDIPDESIDLILCDLPYGVTHNKADVVIPFEPLWEQYERIIKDNGAIVLFGQGLFFVDLVNSNRKLFKYDLVWDKRLVSGFLNAKKMPLRQHEQIAVFYKKPPTYNPQMKIGAVNHSKGEPKSNKNNNYGQYGFTESKQDGLKYPTSVLEFQKPHPSVALHRTEKPVALLEYLIKTYTNEGETVLDNCMGSGSTGVACVNTNRKFIGMELDENYFNIAKDRIEKAKLKEIEGK